MEIDVGIDDPLLANRFLRALWAQIRLRFGKCAWQYTPYKDGRNQRIVFGFMDIGPDAAGIEVSISYRRRGTIDRLRFSFDRGIPGPVEAGLLEAVKTATETMGSARRLKLQTSIASPLGAMSHYATDWFATDPIDARHFRLTLIAEGFDDLDAKTEAQSKLNSLLDVMSAETNAFFWPGSSRRRWWMSIRDWFTARRN